jgi:hypothetical protein
MNAFTADLQEHLSHNCIDILFNPIIILQIFTLDESESESEAQEQQPTEATDDSKYSSTLYFIYSPLIYR